MPPYCLQFCQLAFFLKSIEQIPPPLKTSIQAVGKIKTFNIVIFIIKISQIALVILFYSLGMKPYYCVVAMIISVTCCSIYIILYCKKELQMNLRAFLTNVLGRCFLHFTICLLVGFGIRSLLPSSLLRIIVIIGVSIMMNCATGYYVLLQSHERTTLKNVWKNIKKR